MSALAFGPSVSRALGVEVAASGSMPAHCAEMAASMTMPTPSNDPARPADGPAPTHHPADLLDCCGLCTIAATPMAAPSFALPSWQPVEIADVVVADTAAAGPRQSPPWPTAAPRGPPFLS